MLVSIKVLEIVTSEFSLYTVIDQTPCLPFQKHKGLYRYDWHISQLGHFNDLTPDTTDFSGLV